MTVSEFCREAQLKPISLCAPERVIDGAYTGDLLSWVMGNARTGNAWVTIMTNANVVAVATLIDVSCVVVAENSDIPEETAALAADKGVNLLQSPLSSYELCATLSHLLGQ